MGKNRPQHAVRQNRERAKQVLQPGPREFIVIDERDKIAARVPHCTVPGQRDALFRFQIVLHVQPDPA